jgi:hypothetical protein
MLRLMAFGVAKHSRRYPEIGFGRRSGDRCVDWQTLVRELCISGNPVSPMCQIEVFIV